MSSNKSAKDSRGLHFNYHGNMFSLREISKVTLSSNHFTPGLHQQVPWDFNTAPCNKIPPSHPSHVWRIPSSHQSPSARRVHQQYHPASWRGYQADGASQEEMLTVGRLPKIINIIIYIINIHRINIERLTWSLETLYRKTSSVWFHFL